MALLLFLVAIRLLISNCRADLSARQYCPYKVPGGPFTAADYKKNAEAIEINSVPAAFSLFLIVLEEVV